MAVYFLYVSSSACEDKVLNYCCLLPALSTLNKCVLAYLVFRQRICPTVSTEKTVEIIQLRNRVALCIYATLKQICYSITMFCVRIRSPDDQTLTMKFQGFRSKIIWMNPRVSEKGGYPAIFSSKCEKNTLYRQDF